MSCTLTILPMSEIWSEARSYITVVSFNGVIVGSMEQEYVPHGVVPGEYGDYIHLNIDSDGTIANWPKKPNVKAFFSSLEA